MVPPSYGTACTSALETRSVNYVSAPTLSANLRVCEAKITVQTACELKPLTNAVESQLLPNFQILGCGCGEKYSLGTWRARRCKDPSRGLLLGLCVVLETRTTLVYLPYLAQAWPESVHTVTPCGKT